MPKATLKELREFYLDSGQAARDGAKFVKEYSFQKVLRKIAFYPIWFFLKLGMTANQITLVAFVIGVVGCISIAIGTYLASVVGALLVAIALFLDYVDGFVARYTKNVTNFGAIFDGIYVLLLQLMVLLAISIGLLKMSNQNLAVVLNYSINFPSSNFYLTIGLWTGLVLALRWWLLLEFSSVVSVEPSDTDARSSLSLENHVNILFRIHNLLMTPVYLWPYFLLLASILQLLYLFLLIHALYHTLVLLAYAFYIFAHRNTTPKTFLKDLRS